MRLIRIKAKSAIGIASMMLFSTVTSTKIGLRNIPEDRNQEASWNDGQIWGVGNYDDLCNV